MNAKRRCRLGFGLLASSLLLPACEAKKEPPPPMAEIASDTKVLEQAQGAANAVVRAAGDCDAVLAALPEARHALEEARTKVKTVAGAATLGALEKRVAQVAELCPGAAPPPVE